MINAKIFELRDRGTLIPWLAIRLAYPMSEAERALWKRAGYGSVPEESDCIIQGPAHCSGESARGEVLGYNAQWISNNRTRMAAVFIRENFDALASGQVIDVRTVLGEAAEPVRSEILP